jgi:hypothetical protein
MATKRAKALTKVKRPAVRVKKRGKAKTGPKVDPSIFDDVSALMAACVPSPKIEAKLAKKHGKHERTIREYIARVREYWLEEVKADLPNRKAKRTHQAEFILQRALAAGENRTATATLKLLCELDGLIGPKVQINIPTTSVVVNVVNMTRQQRQRRIHELIAKQSIDAIDVGEDAA